MQDMLASSGKRGFVVTVYNKHDSGKLLGSGQYEYYETQEDLTKRIGELILDEVPFTFGHIHRGTVIEDIPLWYIKHKGETQ